LNALDAQKEPRWTLSGGVLFDSPKPDEHIKKSAYQHIKKSAHQHTSTSKT
jgi:hypothetical protein